MTKKVIFSIAFLFLIYKWSGRSFKQLLYRTMWILRRTIFNSSDSPENRLPEDDQEPSISETRTTQIPKNNEYKIPRIPLVISANEILAKWSDDGESLCWTEANFVTKLLGSQKFLEKYDLYIIVQLYGSNEEAVKTEEKKWSQLIFSCLDESKFPACKLLFCETSVGRAFIARHLEPAIVLESNTESLLQLKQLSRSADICWIGKDDVFEEARPDFHFKIYPKISEMRDLQSLICKEE